MEEYALIMRHEDGKKSPIGRTDAEYVDENKRRTGSEGGCSKNKKKNKFVKRQGLQLTMHV